MDEKIMLSLVDLLYSAAEEPDRWPAFLEAVSEPLRGTMTGVFHFNRRNPASNAAAIVRADPDYLKLYESYYGAINVFVVGKDALIRTGIVLSSEYLCTDEELLSSEYYNDFLRPQGARYAMGIAIANEDGILSVFSSLRAPAAGPLTDADAALLRALAPHLQRAFQLHRRLSIVQSERDRLASLLDTCRFGVMLLDAAGRVVRMNRSAADVCGRHDGIWTEQGRVKTGTAADDSRLQRMIRDAVETGTRFVSTPGGSMAVTRADGSRPYLIVVAPLSRSQTSLENAAAVVFITDPATANSVDPRLLVDAFGLTATESLVACELASGSNALAIAETLHVTENTVRTHLKRIFAKSATKTQAEFAGLVAGSTLNVVRRE